MVTTTSNSLSAILALMSGHAIVRSITVVADLGVPDRLRDGPKTAAELAAACAVDEPSLYRLLRTLAALGVFVETSPGHFALSPISDWLRSDHPQSLRDFVRIRGHKMYWQAWQALDEAVATGRSAFTLAHGAGHFDYLDAHADAARAFHAGLRSLTTQNHAGVVDAYDFGRFRKVIDVGGGEGGLLASILARHPRLRGVLLDTASAVERSADVLRRAGVEERCDAIAGDFFEKIPRGADVAILSRILHNWIDADALRILRNCRTALPADGRLLIVEYVITDDAEGTAAKLFDLQMLVYFGAARERDADEYRALLADAGFALLAIHRLPTSMAVLEAASAQDGAPQRSRAQ
jgi:SAM-dependent methyltransferase